MLSPCSTRSRTPDAFFRNSVKPIVFICQPSRAAKPIVHYCTKRCDAKRWVLPPFQPSKAEPADRGSIAEACDVVASIPNTNSSWSSSRGCRQVNPPTTRANLYSKEHSRQKVSTIQNASIQR
jgi:hypothetical protein